MGRVHRYVDAGGAWSEDIVGVIRIGTTDRGEGGVKGLTQTAELGDSGTSGLSVDDQDSTVGHLSDGIIGMQRWEIDENAAPVGKRRLYTGWVGERSYANSRVLPWLGANVDIDVDLVDLNGLFSFRKFAPDDPDANRPAETCQERLDAVLASELAVGLIVAGDLVEIPARDMDKHRYPGSSLGDVIGDIAIQAGGLNWFARYIEAEDRVELCMYEPNTSTLDTSTFRISTVDADIDDAVPATQTTFAPDGDERLRRSPANTFSVVDVPYARGTVRVERPATEATYARRDGTAPNATIKTAEKAREVGEDFAWRSRNEEDVITATVPIVAEHVNDALEGQRIQVKFRQFRGYTAFTWCRIIRRTPTPWDGSEAGYDVTYELVPQEAADTPVDCSDAYPNTPSGTYYPLGGDNGAPGGPTPNPSGGVVFYWRAGYEYPWALDAGLQGGWHFGLYGVGGAATTDYMATCAQNRLIFVVIGNGTIQIQTAVYGGSTRPLSLRRDGTVLATGDSGDLVVYEIDDRTAGDCVSVLEVIDNPAPCGAYIGFSSMVWTAA